ncbi:hypothetical protein CTI12_AA373220 [Artemisia annua]|uniref:CCHC-type domain-containing protein n=1 Tax=Artemisia annua TaxID=35608 RepID=A0A2U1MJF6_ARTAN|nr:hypothetical protein CTI12_AA373220 [Artemisia annua]
MSVLSDEEDDNLAHFLESEVSDQEEERRPVKRVRVEHSIRIDDSFFSRIPPELFPQILKFLSSEVFINIKFVFEGDRQNPPQNLIDAPDDPYPFQDTSQVGHGWRLFYSIAILVFLAELGGDLGSRFGISWCVCNEVSKAMDTRSASDLKKVIEKLEAEKKTMVEQLKTMQAQILELSVNRRDEDDNETGGSGVHQKGSGTWHSNDIKVDIPEYDGKLDLDEFVEWLRTVECAFDYKETTEENKVKIVAMKLRKYVSTWWANTCTKRERLGKPKVKDWPKMKRLMKQKFLPSYYIQASFSQLHHLKQNQRPAEEYSRDFEYLLMKCDLPEDDPQTLVRYLGGLETRVANVVELYPYSTLDELTLLAHKVDNQQRNKGKFETGRTFTKTPIQPKTSPTNKTPNASENSINPTKAPRRCFRCQGLGHIASECPNKKLVTLAEYEEGDNSYAVDPSLGSVVIADSFVEEIVGPDEGTCLVILLFHCYPSFLAELGGDLGSRFGISWCVCNEVSKLVLPQRDL